MDFLRLGVDKAFKMLSIREIVTEFIVLEEF